MESEVPNEDVFDEDFYFSAAIGDADAIRAIFENGDFGGVNTRNPYGNTPLIIACAWGLDAAEDVAVFNYSEVIELLVENGADVNATNNMGWSALFMAASWGHWDVVEYLLQKGADASDPSILNVASYTTPRGSRNAGEQLGYYYYKHTALAKHHCHRMAKLFMEDMRERRLFGEILTSLEEDYERIVSYTGEDPQEPVPDDVMSLVVYYNHFATVMTLVQAMEPNVRLEESELFLDSVGRLDAQRERFEDLHQE